MKSISKVFLLSIALYTFSCSEDKKSERGSTEVIEELSTTSPSKVTTEPTIADSQTAVSSAIIPTSDIQATPIAKESTKNPVVLNPPHGQPGHDCAVPEGAPLNSKPQTTTTLPEIKPQNTTPNATLPQSNPMLNPTTNLTEQKLNPAHGMPGHDCAIPVGAPLK